MLEPRLLQVHTHDWPGRVQASSLHLPNQSWRLAHNVPQSRVIETRGIDAQRGQYRGGHVMSMNELRVVENKNSGPLASDEFPCTTNG